MEKLTFTTIINAPREKVWHTMLDDATYRKWTKSFNEGSHYEGKWETGSEMRFIGVDETGKEAGGMYSKIKEARPFEFVSIEHLGMIAPTGEIDTTSEEVKKWIPAFENYTLNEKDGGTELLIELDISDEWKDMFNDLWPRALEALKEIAEG
ncbi:MAG: SRPBCC domain-containing protein [Candidatus Pacebacteria bacterium]|jgi:uncharacterized protein YndB with AHSA1/START domain|nr:SRPBCC domain-containing protein [Candidatus Paceibacterota bacterium]